MPRSPMVPICWPRSTCAPTLVRNGVEVAVKRVAVFHLAAGGQVGVADDHHVAPAGLHIVGEWTTLRLWCKSGRQGRYHRRAAVPVLAEVLGRAQPHATGPCSIRRHRVCRPDSRTSARLPSSAVLATHDRPQQGQGQQEGFERVHSADGHHAKQQRMERSGFARFQKDIDIQEPGRAS